MGVGGTGGGGVTSVASARRVRGSVTIAWGHVRIPEEKTIGLLMVAIDPFPALQIMGSKVGIN